MSAPLCCQPAGFEVEDVDVVALADAVNAAGPLVWLHVSEFPQATQEEVGQTGIGPSILWGLVLFFGLPILAISRTGEHACGTRVSQ
jgi:hypothetical protein